MKMKRFLVKRAMESTTVYISILSVELFEFEKIQSLLLGILQYNLYSLQRGD